MGKTANKLNPDCGLLHAKALPPFASLRAFEATFRLGGIRKAAEHLNLNHAVVSRHIKLMEEWLGAQILVRSGNRLSLTDQGQKFHSRVSDAMVELAQATIDLRGERNFNNVRLWCMPGLAIQWLSEQLGDFEKLNPDYKVELRPSDTPANLLHHEADIDIRYFTDDLASHVSSKGLKSVELARPEVIPVAHPDLAKQINKQRSVKSLLSMSLIHEINHGAWRIWLESNGVSAPDNLTGPICWHAHLAVAAAKQGRGVALATRYTAGKDLLTGELTEIKIPGLKPVILGGYFITAREDHWSQPSLVNLRRFLRARAKL